MTIRIPASTVNEIRRLGRLGITPTSIARTTGASLSAVKRHIASDPGGEPVVEDSDWRDRARCASESWAFWGPLASEEEAKGVCLNCPVRNQCLDYALTKKIKTDVWGGYTEEERDGLLRWRTL